EPGGGGRKRGAIRKGGAPGSARAVRPPPQRAGFGGGAPAIQVAPRERERAAADLGEPPEPETVPASAALLPLVSNVPPPELSDTARLVVKPDRNCKVPPPKLSVPELLPRLLSLDTASVPALIAHEVTVLVVLVSVQVLVPVFWNTPKPRYSALPPICETSKLALPLPPSARVSPPRCR